jgi:hypothetical protein
MCFDTCISRDSTGTAFLKFQPFQCTPILETGNAFLTYDPDGMSLIVFHGNNSFRGGEAGFGLGPSSILNHRRRLRFNGRVNSGKKIRVDLCRLSFSVNLSNKKRRYFIAMDISIVSKV